MMPISFDFSSVVRMEICIRSGERKTPDDTHAVVMLGLAVLPLGDVEAHKTACGALELRVLFAQEAHAEHLLRLGFHLLEVEFLIRSLKIL